MTKKFPDLEAFNTGANSNGLIDAIPHIGSPIHDPILDKQSQDGKWVEVIDIDDIAVGDRAVAGNNIGMVTAILDDGTGPPAVKNRIQVTWNTPYIQNQGTDPTNRVKTYNVVDNDEASATTGNERLTVDNALNGLGVIFMKRVVIASGANSLITAADGAAINNGVATEEITLTVYDADGNLKGRGGDVVVFASTGSGVLSGQTDNGDGTYTVLVANAVAETVTISATINNVAVTDTASVVFAP